MTPKLHSPVPTSHSPLTARRSPLTTYSTTRLLTSLYSLLYLLFSGHSLLLTASRRSLQVKLLQLYDKEDMPAAEAAQRALVDIWRAECMDALDEVRWMRC